MRSASGAVSETEGTGDVELVVHCDDDDEEREAVWLEECC